MTPGYIKRADVAWYASHHHTADGLNEPYQYLVPVRLSDRPAGEREDLDVAE